MPDPKDSRFHETGFPSLQWEEEDLPTRPMPFHERPLQARIDHEMAIITKHHIRIALAIRIAAQKRPFCDQHHRRPVLADEIGCLNGREKVQEEEENEAKHDCLEL